MKYAPLLLLLAFPAIADEESELAIATRELHRRAEQIVELAGVIQDLKAELQAERGRKSVRCAVVKPERKS